MPSTQPAEPDPTHDVPEKRRPWRDDLADVLMIGMGGLLMMAWLCLLALLGWWLIGAVV
jgi:hypothetical protein